MILPVHVYGDPILRIETQDVEADSPELQQLIDDMIETMRGADGAGLAAPRWDARNASLSQTSPRRLVG